MAERYEKEQVISGFTYFNDKIDGNMVSSGALFVLQELDTSRGTSKGQRTVEKPCSDADVVKRIMHLECPIKCKVVYEERVSKRSEKLVVVDCVPIASARIPANAPMTPPPAK